MTGTYEAGSRNAVCACCRALREEGSYSVEKGARRSNLHCDGRPENRRPYIASHAPFRILSFHWFALERLPLGRGGETLWRGRTELYTVRRSLHRVGTGNRVYLSGALNYGAYRICGGVNYSVKAKHARPPSSSAHTFTASTIATRITQDASFVTEPRWTSAGCAHRIPATCSAV